MWPPVTSFFSNIRLSSREIRVALAASVVAGFATFFSHDVVVSIYSSLMHPVNGEWEDRTCKTTLAFFGDNTAVHGGPWGKSSCIWSQKERGLFILKCSIFKDADKTSIFRLLPNGEAYLDDMSMHRKTQEAGSAAHFFSCERE